MKPYDVDVVVIGAGPAGLAAALRLRWVKGYRPLPASVLLVDPEAPGGLAAFGGCVLTGPAWAMGAQGMLGPLRADMDALNIPLLKAKVDNVCQEPGGIFRVEASDQAPRRCLAVIVATGLRALHGEARYFGRGLHVTYKGYEHFPSLVEAASRDAHGRGLVVIGHDATLDLVPILAPHTTLAGGITLLLQGPAGPRRVLPEGIRQIQGAAVDYSGEAWLSGVTYHPADADDLLSPQSLELPCGAVLIDYHAFERRPERGLAGIPRDPRGFVPVDAHLATPTPGLFAAGDVTGRWASATMALGDGVCAGFSAYRYVFQRKFDREPSLFAYAPSGPSAEEILQGDLQTRPFPLPADASVCWLAPPTRADAFAAELGTPAAAPLLRDGAPVSALREALGGEVAGDTFIFEAWFRRLLTVHSLPRGPHGPPLA